MGLNGIRNTQYESRPHVSQSSFSPTILVSHNYITPPRFANSGESGYNHNVPFDRRKEIRGMTVLKSGIRELAIKAHEMGAGVLRGPLQRLDEERGWAVGNVHLRD
jgi:hypothetical protein